MRCRLLLNTVHSAGLLGRSVRYPRRAHHMPPINVVQKPEELVQIVDEQNKPIGAATRAEMRSQNLIHRCSFTVVQNTEVRFLVLQSQQLLLDPWRSGKADNGSEVLPGEAWSY